MMHLDKDLGYAIRILLRNRVFTVTALLTLALGIGGNTAMFTVIHAVRLKQLPYRDPDRLVRLPVENLQRGAQNGLESQAEYEEVRADARSFSEIGAFGEPEYMTLSGNGEPEQVNGARVSSNFLHILGVEPVVGRSFLAEEDRPGGAPVAMISTRLWTRRFGRDPRIVGKIMALNSTPHTIIGVLPPDFAFPFAGFDVWVTRPSEWSVIPPQSWGRAPDMQLFARLNPRASIEQARAEMRGLHRRYALTHPEVDRNATIQVTRLSDLLVAGNMRVALWMLFGAAGFVLSIACANVASLLLARAISRTREFAVRVALGATPLRLIGQLLTESVLLALAGGALGVLLGEWTLSLIARANTLPLPRGEEIRLDGTALGFTLALSIATGVLSGLLPSLRVSRTDPAKVLREQGAAATGSRTRMFGLNTRSLLVIGEVALSLTLLIAATLLMKSLTRIEGTSPGFQPANLLTMKLALPASRYDTNQKRAAFFEELVRRVEALPGIRGAAASVSLPTTGDGFIFPMQVAELPPMKLNERPIGNLQSVTSGYFQTLGIPLRRGREFTTHDAANAPPVAIVNEALARRFWPDYPQGTNPVGEHIFSSSIQREIVGVVADVHETALSADTLPEMYLPMAQNGAQYAYLTARVEGDPLRVVNAIRGQVRTIDRDQPVALVRTMEDILGASLAPQRTTLLLMGWFSGVALLLAAVGLYGVIAYSVAQRAQEMGIRRALGAQKIDILWLVMGQGLGLTLAGIALGIGGALALTRAMRGLLFHVSATDPGTFVGIVLLYVLVALAASYIPARRATRIDPMAALR